MEVPVARIKSENLVTQTIVDRLVDRDSWPETRAASVAMYRESLKRDLEWLLNTRQPVLPILESFPATSKSVFNFGFPDLHSFDGSAGKEQNALVAAMERCIRTFEPRIRQARVFLTRTDLLSRSLKFHIEGQLVFDNVQEDIKFDTVLELISGEYAVN